MFAAIGLVAFIVINNSSRSTRPTATDPITPRPSRIAIIDGSFAVNARGYYYFPFEVPRRAHVTGSFTAQGGKNDIEAVIFDRVGYENFSTGNRARNVYYYSGGYVYTDTLDLYLPPGSYVFVFNNKDALITNKAVTAHITVEY